MNTFSLCAPAIRRQCAVEMNTFQLLSVSNKKIGSNEYFPLGIPLFALDFLVRLLPGCGFECERVSNHVGDVPQRVRKVAFQTSPLQGLLTLVNRLF